MGISDSDEARDNIVETARAMMSGSLDLVTGCRRLCDLRHRVGASDSELFRPIIAFESQTDDYPLGAVRSFCEENYLKQLDEQMDAYLADASQAVLAACRRIIESLG